MTDLDRFASKDSRVAVVIGRWIAVLPAAIIASLIADVLFGVVNRFTMAPYVDPDSFMGRLFLEYMGGAVFGAVAVYTGSFVAPRYKEPVALVVAALVLLTAGFSLFPSILENNYWAIFSILCTAAGAAFMAYAILSGEIDVGEEIAA